MQHKRATQGTMIRITTAGNIKTYTFFLVFTKPVKLEK